MSTGEFRPLQPTTQWAVGGGGGGGGGQDPSFTVVTDHKITLL